MARKTPEGRFDEELTEDIRELLPGCFILKNDEQYVQGIPDRLILWRDRWAMLEVKKSAAAARRPNQDYYVKMFDGMSFAAFVFPENKHEILKELDQHFR